MIKTQQKNIDRTGFIGGSDVSVIMGLSSYKTSYQLYLEKKGLVQPNQEETSAQYFGKVLEPVIRSEFERRNSVTVETPKDPISHPLFPFLRGNLDGWIPSLNAVFEAKTANQFSASNWGESGSDIFPMPYLIQIATYCSIMNCETAHLAVLIGGSDYRQYKYTRDLVLENKIIQAACDFWNQVQTNSPPAAVNISDLKLLYPRHDPGKCKTINYEVDQQLTSLKEIRSKIKDLEDAQDKERFNIMQFMNEHENLVDESDNVLATWKTNKSGNRTFLLKGK